ncbi:hypothetical protein OU995_13530 [Roseateles sp. SL47]|uniref:hypothetical protein n=1 Tax=Roseateles sp. SL47 TaxID=2995138 RepID=UPI00226FD67F|nr:hypothetical protein [Roseateles sp. SL47]WAC75650.1 hypothetical protein OU995_13530 [Roseateles sp. SL47]
MFYAISWFSVVLLLALWSLTAWVLHAVAVWAVSHAGAWSGAASQAISPTLPDWLSPWVPSAVMEALTQSLAALGPMVDSLLQAAPALAGGLSFVTWAVWGIGSALLLLMGVGLHLLIAAVRRHARRAAEGASQVSPAV